ncbi:MAG TPA: hypothetical protein P5081_11300 [Phycisphaerae bacterium]|nr:hypothetical protein [Phycisphaerae bacterium]HRW53466.1 hypothetical protein [Phycisphaerae bacterium]
MGRRVIVIAVLPLLSIGFFFCAGCRPKAPATPATPAIAVTAQRPDGAILFQTYFQYDFKKDGMGGAGFFIRTPEGKNAAVIAASSVKADMPALVSVNAVNIGDYAPLAVMAQSWGEPGRPGKFEPTPDYQHDYIVMPIGEMAIERTLQLDDRAGPVQGEPVWFPFMTEHEPRGYLWMDGVVDEVWPGYIRVRIDSTKTVRSQEGAPIVSGTTGKVIGIVARAGKIQQKTVLWLCPADSIRQGMKKAKSFPMLKDVVRGGGA